MDVDVAGRPAPRAGHGAVRDDDEREPGADAGHRHARGPRRGARHLRRAGRCGRRSSARSPTGPAGGGCLRIRDGLDGAGAGRRAGRRRCTRTRRSTTGPGTAPAASTPHAGDPAPAPDRRAATDLLGHAGSTRRWVCRQYDHQLFLNTVVGPGGDAAVLRLQAPGLPASTRGRGLALTTDGNHRWCALDPRRRHGARRGRVGRSTWPASAPARWPSSTASTSATPSTPR